MRKAFRDCTGPDNHTTKTGETHPHTLIQGEIKTQNLNPDHL